MEQTKSPEANCDDEFDFPELTDQDFAQMDAVVEQHLAASKSPDAKPISRTTTEPTTPDEAEITVQVEQELTPNQVTTESSSTPPKRAEFNAYSRANPFESHRSWRPLSVSDLSGPAWCELQFDYGLRGKRHLKAKDRPDSFVSGGGKTITIAKTTAVSNERTMKAGTAVHKRLEREIRPKPIYVAVTSAEETWGLRLVKMLACVEDLLTLGFCREMPVFGIVHDHIVVGIIDEICMKQIPEPETGDKRNPTSSPSTPRKPKRTRSNESPTKRDLSALLKESSHQLSGEPLREGLTHTLHVCDNKTRYSKSLPLERDTISSKLQLMLYHRLLSGFAAPFPSPGSLDFNDFWPRVQVIPSRPFSRAFCEQSGLPVGEEGQDNEKLWSINDLLSIWTGLITGMGVHGVDNELTLVYRSRTDKASAKGKGVSRSDTLTTDPRSTEEEIQIAQAIKASLLDIGVEGDVALAQALAESIRDAGPIVEPSVVVEEAQFEPVSEEDNIIGSKVFSYDGAFLDNHLDAVFDWWHGIRPPIGVDIEDSGRCRTCEYRDDCEWRTSKAQEALIKARSPVIS